MDNWCDLSYMEIIISGKRDVVEVFFAILIFAFFCDFVVFFECLIKILN